MIQTNTALDTSLRHHLLLYRSLRKFNPGDYINAKAALLNRYLSRFNLSAVIVGVSGGIDSAVTLGIANEAMKMRGSPIRRLIGALIPVFDSKGATAQGRALTRGRLVVEAMGGEPLAFDIGGGVASLKQSVDEAFRTAGTPWAEGQLVSYSRTPALYYLSSLVAEQGFPAIVCGTTNRDEGAYIGFFGKASDAMVDLQLISDIHKSEVAAVAKVLKVPQEVVSAVPTGDTYDGKPDELMIGASYEFLELYQHYLTLGAGEQATLLDSLSPQGGEQFKKWGEAIEVLHRKNLHKYLSGTVAVHIDVMPRAVPGGWKEDYKNPHTIDETKLVNPVSLPANILNYDTSLSSKLPLTNAFEESPFTVSALLSREECGRIVSHLESLTQVPVGQDGRAANFDSSKETIGSWRATAVNEEIAGIIWNRLKSHLSPFRIVDERGFTDGQEHPVWKPVAINPVLRFISYKKGGALVPHYDAGFDFKDGSRHTLMTLVIYLTDGDPTYGGATRFLRDPQRHLPYNERNFEDWNRFADDDEVLLKVTPEAGKALVFDHRLLHDGERWDGDSRRVLLRTDIIFERCGSASTNAEKVSERQIVHSQNQKILSDPFYRGVLHQTGSEGAVFNAGFFEDSGPLGERSEVIRDVHWLSTPLQKVMKRFERSGDSGKIAVLLSTGAFCPIHQGHIAMMEAARRELELRGYFVLGGFFSPSHDEYVQSKCGSAALLASHRIALAREAVMDSDWLSVDPWESQCCKRDINFTETIEHLSSYLSWHVPSLTPIEVFYVFGGDNARFAGTFTTRGGCVCIPRGSSHELEEVKNRREIQANPRIIFSLESVDNEASSTKVREGDTRSLPPAIRQRWDGLRRGGSHGSRAVLRLRDEGAWLYQHWGKIIDPAQLESARGRFLKGLCLAFERSFKAARLPDRELHLSLEILSLEKQRSFIACTSGQKRYLSLDTCSPLAYNLNVSRLYDLSDSRNYHGIISRPGSLSLQSQIRKIPSGNYSLVDDDISTGKTIAAVRKLLPDCVFEEEISLADAVSKNRYHESDIAVADLGDSRDLLVGSFDAGLVVKLFDGTIARAPYLLPYVQPSERLSIPYSMEIHFSAEVWRLNEVFFRELPHPLCISDTPVPFQRLASAAGFSREDSLEMFCRYHALRLAKSCNEGCGVETSRAQILTHYM